MLHQECHIAIVLWFTYMFLTYVLNLESIQILSLCQKKIPIHLVYVCQPPIDYIILVINIFLINISSPKYISYDRSIFIAHYYYISVTK